MGLDSKCAENVRKVMQDVLDGVDVREGATRERAIKLTDGDQAVIRDCLRSGFGLSQATATSCARRLKRRKMISLAKYRARVKQEVARVANLTGGIWATAPKKNDILKTHHSSQTRV